jgi:hypothetical protein
MRARAVVPIHLKYSTHVLLCAVAAAAVANAKLWCFGLLLLLLLLVLVPQACGGSTAAAGDCMC